MSEEVETKLTPFELRIVQREVDEILPATRKEIDDKVREVALRLLNERLSRQEGPFEEVHMVDGQETVNIRITSGRSDDQEETRESDGG